MEPADSHYPSRLAVFKAKTQKSLGIRHLWVKVSDGMLPDPARTTVWSEPLCSFPDAEYMSRILGFRSHRQHTTKGGDGRGHLVAGGFLGVCKGCQRKYEAFAAGILWAQDLAEAVQ